MTAVTIRETAVDEAIALREKGIGPDRILMMVSTDPEHHYANSGTTLSQYWKEAERCIRKAADVGIKMCGTVSTIWGSPRKKVIRNSAAPVSANLSGNWTRSRANRHLRNGPPKLYSPKNGGPRLGNKLQIEE